jgi:hypothetical protein
MERRHFAAAFALLCLLAAIPLTVKGADSSQLMVALRTMPAQADKFRSMMSNLNASQFRLVSVQSAMSAGDEAAFKTSMKKNAGDLADLRDTLQHTTVTGADGVVTPLKKVLLAKNVSIEQVIGVYVAGDGQITLFYQ